MAQWKEYLDEMMISAQASASELDAEARTAVQLLLTEASDSSETGALLQVVESEYSPRTAEGQLIPMRAYLHGSLYLALDNREKALEILPPLCEKLEQAKRWEDLGAVADETFKKYPELELARYLAKAAEQGGRDSIPDGGLPRALDQFPDEQRLCWLVAEEAEEKGDSDRAMALFISCLPSLIDSKNMERIEEVFVRLDDRHDTDSTRTVMQSCFKLAGMKQWKLAETYLEPLLPHIKKHGFSQDAWNQMIKLLPRAPEDTALRRFMMEIADEAIPGVDGLIDLLGRSGIMDPAVKVDEALKALKKLLEFAPGYRVLHHNWGPGRIRAADPDAIVVDFKDKPGHRMSMAIARKGLQIIPTDDLRVLMMEKPDEVAAMVRAKSPDIAYLAIRELGGKATTQELRRRMTAELIKTSTWSTWWKEVRTKLEEDERFDLSESFQQTYAIRRKDARDADAMILPKLDRRRGIRANLNLLRRFLDQHPDKRDRSIKVYTPMLTRWLREENTKPEPAVAICLMLDQWQRLDMSDLDIKLKEMLIDGIEIQAFADEVSQRLLAERAMELEGLAQAATLFALGSRYESIREMALTKLREDPDEGNKIVSDLMSRPEEHPQTSLTLIVTAISEEEQTDPLLPTHWRATAALARLVDRIGRDTMREQVLRLFRPTSQLAQRLRKQEAPEEVQFLLQNTFRRWQESEQYLFPILEFLDEMGQSELVANVRGERTASTNRLLRSQSDHKYDGYYLTRATQRKMSKKIAFLSNELKTTVAKALQTAREMGDLSENAEYDAAKEKQANFMDQITSLTEELSSSTLIEHVSVPEGESGPGSWIEIKVVEATDLSPGAQLSYWLLGAGDNELGEEVISCASPAGLNLLGKKVGDAIKMISPDGNEYSGEIISAKQKLPEEEPPA
jgi:transcription elongation factor GreA